MLAQWLKASCCGAKPIATAALGQKATSADNRFRSALPPGTDIDNDERAVRFVPISAVRRIAMRLSSVSTQVADRTMSIWPR